jgi:hypothetical protein
MISILKSKVCDDVNKVIYGMIEGLTLSEKIRDYPYIIDLFETPTEEGEFAWNEELIEASIAGDLRLVRFFLEKGATDLYMALMYSAQYGQRYVMSFLEDMIQDEDQELLNEEMFRYAVIGGHMDIVEVMIGRGVRDWEVGYRTAYIHKHLEMETFFSILILRQ